MANVSTTARWDSALPMDGDEATLSQVQSLLQEADRHKRMLTIAKRGGQRIFRDRSGVELLWCSAETLEASMVMNALENPGTWM